MKTATLHTIYGEDDIMIDLGWTGVELVVAVDWSTGTDDPDIVAVGLTYDQARQAAQALGYETNGYDDVFVHNGKEWVRRT